LHRTDGTPQGTVELSATGFGALSMVAFNGKLYMNLEGSNGWELHVSDGSGAAPTELLDVNPNGDAGPRLLEIYEGHLYFAADDGVNGAELWRTDGTQAGTALVVPLTPPGVHSIISDLVICNGLALFLLRSRDPPGYYETLGVWRTDGTPAGTFSVKDIAPGENFMTWLGPGVLMEDRVYFGVDGTSCEIWSTDGSMVGTRKEWTAPTGTTAGASMQVHDNALYFTLQRAGSWRPHEVWRLDGGEATMLFDFHLIGDATSVSFLGSTESCVFMLLLNTDDAPAWESTCWVLRTNADFSGSSGKDKDQNGCSTACANSRSVWVFLILGTILAALRRRLSHAPGATPVDEPAWRLGLTKSDGGNHRIACSPELMPRKW
jgi:ELWxxDGT repeat protein